MPGKITGASEHDDQLMDLIINEMIGKIPTRGRRNLFIRRSP